MHAALKNFLWILICFGITSGIFALSGILRGSIHRVKKIIPDVYKKESDGIQYVGHATVLIQLNGIRILTDPILTRTIQYLIQRFISVGINKSLLNDIDLVVISHWHSDHFSPRSLKKINKNATILVPKGLQKRVMRRGFTNVIEMNPRKSINFKGIKVYGVPTDHGSARGALGYVFKGSKTIYFPGDTAFSQDNFSIISKEHDIDIALLPIGCYRGYIAPYLNFSLGMIHMGPHEIPDANQILKPKCIVPIHWGTFIIGTEPINWAIKNFKDLSLKNPKIPTQIINHGKFSTIEDLIPK